MARRITYKPFGVNAILIEWEPIISEEILENILSLKNKIEKQKKGFFTDLIVGYNSLTIKYLQRIDNFSNEVKDLEIIYKSNLKIKNQTNYLWKIPVCYDLQFGIDLEEISRELKLSIEKIIQLHSKKEYTVFFIGFLPGFLYLGGLNEKLFFNRKSTPRLKVDKGAIAIGGEQTGVYPMDSAGGWNIIGKTPVNFFNIENTNPCFVKAGDKIKFEPVSLSDYSQIEKEVISNKYQISKTLLK